MNTYIINTNIFYIREGETETEIDPISSQIYIVDAIDEEEAILKLKISLHKEGYEIRLNVIYISKKII
jgi:hypothetical protein